MNDFAGVYAEWLKKNILSSLCAQGWMEISTPFLDSHNDCLVVYVKQNNEGAIALSDDCYTLSDADKESDDGRKRYWKAIRAIQSYNIMVTDDNEMFKTTDEEHFAFDFNIFLRAMMLASDVLNY